MGARVIHFSVSLLILGLTAQACNVAPTLKTIEPGDVAEVKLVLAEGGQRPARVLEGSFTVLEGGSGAINSTGTGGACLVTDLNHMNLPTTGPFCDSDADCGGGLPGSDPKTADPKTAWSGYCLETENENENGPPSKTCWVRPGPDSQYCLKGPDVPWTVGTKNTFRTPIYKDSQTPHLRALPWRVLACLNPFDSSKGRDARACGKELGTPYKDEGNITMVPN